MTGAGSCNLGPGAGRRRPDQGSAAAPTIDRHPPPRAGRRRVAARLAGLLLGLLTGLAWGPAAQAQFSMVPAPQLKATPRPSAAEIETEYRIDAARHVYAAYPSRIYRGRLPPLLYGIMMIETELDTAGQVVAVHVVRKPAADEVAPWVLAMLRRAAPYPAPATMPGGTVRFTETWFVDRSGLFQLFSLTEGQR